MKSHSISFRITPKGIAYAIFHRQHLLFWEAHSVISDPKTTSKHALNAAFRFDRFNIEEAVLEKLSDETEVLCKVIKEGLQSRGVPAFEVSDKEIFDSFGLPAPKDWQELRQAAAPLFPQVSFARFMYPCLEAAAVGLYFETSRLLSINKPLE